jgi:type II secretory pathway component PulF
VKTILNVPSSGLPRSECAGLIHELRNALNAMVTSNSCLQLCPIIPSEYQRFVRAGESNGGVARRLLDDLDKLLVDGQQLTNLP